MIFSKKRALGEIALHPQGPFQTGERVTLTLTFTVGGAGLRKGAQLRLGLPNTGWERPVVPQLRYWDELVAGNRRSYAPFHPVNTTAAVKTKGKAVVFLESMERMLLPDEDPAEAYWRWWVTAGVEDAALRPGDQIVLTYGDPRFLRKGARVQTFPENDLTIAAYVNSGNGKWFRPGGAPIKVDVVSGPAVRANVTVPSVVSGQSAQVRIALTDACHCRPSGGLDQTLILRDRRGRKVGKTRFLGPGPAAVRVPRSLVTSGGISVTDVSGNRIWGVSNPAVPSKKESGLFWGDLHAQSEYHVMHSQKKDARQKEWSKGISCGTPDEVYQYARDVALLDFVAITDQGAITGIGWELLCRKAAEYLRPGRFVTFNAYEAGSPVGHRNVYYRGGECDPPQRSGTFSYMPDFLYKYYAGRRDVMMIPHHVKTWTDWSFHDPDLEPVMEVYSCWGQSENPSVTRWEKGMTPGAGAWEALRRGYRLGMIASSDNHVGMAGRSFPHDRQVHTPFAGGLAAVWAPELSREAIFDSIRARRCYGTTGARIILEFSVNDQPMGSEVRVEGRRPERKIRIDARGTDEIERAEILCNGAVVHTATPESSNTAGVLSLEWKHRAPIEGAAFYYVRLLQADGEMAWSSPIWLDAKARR